MTSSRNQLTTQQFAERAGVTAATVSRWIRSGKLKAEKKGNKWMLHEEQLDLVAPAPQSPEPVHPNRPAPSGPAPKTSDSAPKKAKSYTVAEFSAMTYLTEFGVTQWLKRGRLKGDRDESGNWRVEAGNLERADIQRLVRK